MRFGKIRQARRGGHDGGEPSHPAGDDSRRVEGQSENDVDLDDYLGLGRAMQEMKHIGHMPNHMRMYWGKKILEWRQDPEEAFNTTLAINNKYFLDGRDPNSYAGVAWLFGKHDRPWPERPIFGKVRYMAASGLERKCDIQAYVQKVHRRISA